MFHIAPYDNTFPMEFVVDVLLRIMVTFLLLTFITTVGVLIMEGVRWFNEKR